jgi:hypothetical protein
MFKQFLLGALVVSLAFSGSFQSRSQDNSGSSSGDLSQARTEVRRIDSLLDEIAGWIATQFELPAATERPSIVFVPRAKLAMMHAKDRAASYRVTGSDENDQRPVVALYNKNSKTIFLPNDWTMSSKSDQSILVHEMVHHLQNLANLKFECPMAGEKAAYMAQDKWLNQFGMSLEKEFEVDMFTVLISSACMY